MGTRWLASAPARPEGARGRSGGVLRSAWLVTALVAIAGLIGVAVRRDGDDRDPVTVAALGSEAARTAADEASASMGSAGDGSTGDDSADRFGGGGPMAAEPGPAPAPAPVTRPGEPEPRAAESAPLAGGPTPDASSDSDGPGPAPAAPASTPVPAAPTAPMGPAPSLPPVGPGGAAASCADGGGEPTTEQMGDLDLLETSITRDGAGLRIRFRLAGSPAGAPTVRQPSVGDPGGPATTSWGVWMASNGEVLYGVTVVRDGDAWTTTLVSQRSVGEDRIYERAAPTEPEIVVEVPAEAVPSLPEAFDWWAWSDTNRRAPAAGNYLGDDCPNGASETAVSTPGLARFPA